MKSLLFGCMVLLQLSAVASANEATKEEIVEAINGSLVTNPLNCTPKIDGGAANALNIIIEKNKPFGEFVLNIDQDYQQPIIEIIKNREASDRRYLVKISTDPELKVVESITIYDQTATRSRTNNGTILNPEYSTELIYKNNAVFICH